jgi:IS605 OrfB family transposase
MEIKTNNLLIFPIILEHTVNMFSSIRDDSKKSFIGRESGKTSHLWGYSVGVYCSALALLKVFMRIVAHGIVYFKNPSVIKSIKTLMLNWSSCRRSAYQAIHKYKLVGNLIKIYCKKNYMSLLNQRYVADAVSEASKIEQEHALFGGKKLWHKFQVGSISKKKWNQIRNNTLYSRGDRTKKGNPNIRIVGNQLWVNDPETGWLKGKLWLNKPVNLKCYESRIQLKEGKFHVTFSWDEPDPPKITDKSKGVFGIDTNPNGEALTEINETGNIQSHIFLKNERIQYAQLGKRDYDIKQMAVKIVSIALRAGKPLVLEKLNFKNKKKSRKFNRMAHNFIHRKMIEAIKSCALKSGVEVIEVPAAYTSIVGKLKYQDMYSLSVHNAAAMVIGRLGFLNKSDKVVIDVSGSEERPKLEARGQSVTLKKKSFLWFKSKFRVCQKQPGLTAPCLVSG